MLRKPLLSLLLALLLVAVFVGGLVRLFVLRYEVGDVYPPYSTLRADPLGTKALVAALGELPHVEVRRNFKSLPKLRPDGPVTLVYAGVVHHSYWTEGELLAFDSLLAGGSRAIFTFFPVEKSPSASEDKRADETEQRKKENSENEKDGRKKKSSDEKKKVGRSDEAKAGEEKNKKTADRKKDAKDGKSKAKKKDAKDEEGDDEEEARHKELIRFETVAKRWGFDFAYLPEDKDRDKDKAPRAILAEPGSQLERDISWHSALYFKDLKPQWKVLYTCATKPVVIERKFGDGSVILAADSFFLSNEALRGERHPHLISRLFDGPPTIIFDEEHNRLRDDPGIASLARKYRLHGVVATLLLLAIFFVWKNAVRFVPAYESDAVQSDVIAGKESSEGFINLLRRSIRPSAVFDVCVAEWAKVSARKPREVAKVQEIRAQSSAGSDPVTAYVKISRALARKI